MDFFNPLIVLLDSRKSKQDNKTNGVCNDLTGFLTRDYEYSLFYGSSSDSSDEFEYQMEAAEEKESNLQCKLHWTCDEIESFLVAARNKLIVNKHDSLIFMLTGDSGDYYSIIDINGDNYEFSDIFDQFSGFYDGYLYFIPKLFLISTNNINTNSKPNISKKGSQTSIPLSTTDTIDTEQEIVVTRSKTKANMATRQRLRHSTRNKNIFAKMKNIFTKRNKTTQSNAETVATIFNASDANSCGSSEIATTYYLAHGDYVQSPSSKSSNSDNIDDEKGSMRFHYKNAEIGSKKVDKAAAAIVTSITVKNWTESIKLCVNIATSQRSAQTEETIEKYRLKTSSVFQTDLKEIMEFREIYGQGKEMFEKDTNSIAENSTFAGFDIVAFAVGKNKSFWHEKGIKYDPIWFFDGLRIITFSKCILKCPNCKKELKMIQQDTDRARQILANMDGCCTECEESLTAEYQIFCCTRKKCTSKAYLCAGCVEDLLVEKLS